MKNPLALLALAGLFACEPAVEGEVATPAPAPAPVAAKIPADAAADGLAADLSAQPAEGILLRLNFAEGEEWGEESEFAVSFGIANFDATMGIAFAALGEAEGSTRIQQSPEWMRVEVDVALFSEDGGPLVYDSRNPDADKVFEAFFPPEFMAEMEEMEEMWGEEGENPFEYDFDDMFGHKSVTLVDSRKRATGYELPDDLSGFPGYSEEDAEEAREMMAAMMEWTEGWMEDAGEFGWGSDMMVFPEAPVALGDTWTQEIEWVFDLRDMMEMFGEEGPFAEMFGEEESAEMHEGMEEALEAMGEGEYGYTFTADLTHEVVDWWEGLLRLRTEGEFLITIQFSGMEEMMKGFNGISISVSGETLWHPSGYIAGNDLKMAVHLELGEEMRGDMGEMGMMASMFMPTINMTMRRVDPASWDAEGDI